MIDLLPDPAVAIDGDGKVFRYNHLMRDLLGDTVTGADLAEYIGIEHTDMIDAILECNQRKVQTHFDRKIKIKTVQGKEVFLRCRCITGVFDREVALIPIMFSFAQDASRIEQALTKANQDYQRLITALSNTCFYYCRKVTGEIYEVSDFIYNITGLWPGDIEGNFTNILTESDTNKVFAEHAMDVASLRTNHLPAEMEIEVYSQRKDKLTFKVIETPIIENGVVQHIECIAIDVTVQKRANNLLHVYHHFFEHASSEIYLFDKQSLHFTEVNRGARRNLGYTIEELRKMTPLDIKKDLDPDVFNATLKSLDEQEMLGQITVESDHYRKDGSYYSVIMRIQLIRMAKEPLYLAMSEPVRQT